MSFAEQMLQVAQDAKLASQTMARLSSAVKDELLQKMAQSLLNHTEELIEENEKDLAAASPPAPPASGPPEIAVSILAEMTRVLRRGT